MKRILILGAGILVTLSILSTPFVFAVEETSDNSTSQTSQHKTPEEAAKALAERIAKHKAALKTKLTTTEKTRIANRCKASQGLVGSVSGRVKGIETSRTKVHANIVSRLTDLSDKLKVKGADTTALDASIVELKTKVTTFETDLTAYKQTVSDLAELDCKTDPEGFKAALEAARTSQKTTAQDSLAIKTYLNETIKPLLKTARAQIETNTSTTGGQQ